ncbi:arylsulfatase B-like [Patiria miniata]|uniref:Sulfatase N-terminal domain-containing protein n=1 Tax=Patiria miniata TaxID=46514 RepID=A0A913ZN81_PATMI|nr:arylsulfatase B-like [Patiria miniata]
MAVSTSCQRRLGLSGMNSGRRKLLIALSLLLVMASLYMYLKMTESLNTPGSDSNKNLRQTSREFTNKPNSAEERSGHPTDQLVSAERSGHPTSDQLVNAGKKQQPNIVFILADDYGYSDIGYHGSVIKTPVLDRLAAEGVKLNNYYVQPICTPTRTQLMTGRYQIHTGFQHAVLEPQMPSCLPLDEITIAQKLKEAGYSTHIVGKWHLGFYKKACWPTRRGFDTFFGFLEGSGTYFSHMRNSYYDFRDQEDVAWQYKGQYSTHLFAKRAQEIITKKDKDKPFFLFVSMQAVHIPLQVPDSYVHQYEHIISSKPRQKYAAMTTCMDEAVGNITRTLEELSLWNNTLLIFSTDNGGAPEAGAFNWPLRGRKKSLWEGGIRGIGFVHSPLLDHHVRGTESNQLIHVSDWFPTIVSGLAGGSLNGTKPLDGYNLWDSIRSGTPSPRQEILHNIDPFEGHGHRPFSHSLYNNFTFTPSMRAAVRVGDWKLLTGPVGDGHWTPPPESGKATIRSKLKPHQNVWLFNVKTDPNEENDMSEERPDILQRLMDRLQEYYSTSVPVIYPESDKRGHPKKIGVNYWTNWM